MSHHDHSELKQVRKLFAARVSSTSATAKSACAHMQECDDALSLADYAFKSGNFAEGLELIQSARDSAQNAIDAANSLTLEEIEVG